RREQGLLVGSSSISLAILLAPGSELPLKLSQLDRRQLFHRCQQLLHSLLRPCVCGGHGKLSFSPAILAEHTMRFKRPPHLAKQPRLTPARRQDYNRSRVPGRTPSAERAEPTCNVSSYNCDLLSARRADTGAMERRSSCLIPLRVCPRVHHSSSSANK